MIQIRRVFYPDSERPLDDFSEFEREQEFDQALLKPLPKPELTDVKSQLGETKACNDLEIS